ncbi:transcriptional regulator family: Fungal Specific TF [Penicillium angulare]|uniref:Transcriptional regulator family: Fungal Specific TF n=1 Tax=Penicillium angulare TaxID=116970 RepID=A0A9W9EVC2_9EURO|nr:transcriptional regulator family: Fungal Specific TF [Penicillium angulare]
MTTPLAARSGRVGRPKSKTGCDTCKARRVRCGEEKPQCLRCSSTGRQCSYSLSSTPNGKKTESPHQQIALYSHQGSRERRAFEYYFHKAGPALSGVLDVAFWRGSVLQICRMEPAIWDAIISLSSLYERPPIHESSPFRLINSPAEVEHLYHHEALVWYSRSLAVVQQRIDRGEADLSVCLISCILFIAIELLQGNRRGALNLCTQGIQMMNTAIRRATGSMGAVSNKAFIDRASLFSVVKPIFRRLDTWALITDGTSSTDWSFDPDPVNMQVKSIEEARNVLCNIVTDMKSLNIETKRHWNLPAEKRANNISDLASRRSSLKNRLSHWHQSFTSLPNFDQDSGGSALLLMTFTSVLIEIETCLDSNQMTYDNFEAEFTQIIDYATTAISSTRSPEGNQPRFVFEVGVFLPLFITALKCRFPRIRRRALQLLHEAPPAQGVFMCVPAAQAVAVLVALEEEPTTALTISGTEEVLSKPGCIPPARNRIWEFNVSSDNDPEGRTRNWLHYSLQDFYDIKGGLKFIQNVVLFPGAQQ